MEPEPRGARNDEGQAEDEEQSLEDILREAFDEASDEAGDDEPESEASDEGGEEPEEHDEEADSGDESDSEEEADDEGEEHDADDESGAQDADEDDEPAGPPEHWSSDDKKAYNDLPDEAKPLYMDKVKSLERGYNEKFEEMADQRKAAEAYDEALKPLDPVLQQAGMQRTDWIRNAMQVEQVLQSNPQAAIQHLAQTYNVDLSQLSGDGSGGDDDEDYLDPRAQKEIERLRGEVNRLSSTQQQVQQREQQQHQTQVQTQINDFANATDGDGNLSHPHFETVRSDMGRLMNAGMANTMDEAYQKAVQMNPELESQPKSSEPKETGRKTGEQSGRDRARKAKRASRKAPRRKSKSATKDEGDMSLRDSLSAAWDENIEE